MGWAKTHFEQHHLGQARRDYALAFKRTPNAHADTDVAAQVGVVKLFLNNAPRAVQELKLATVLNLRNDFTWYYLTVARTVCHQPKAAAASCKESIKWHLKRPEGYVSRALLNCSIKDYKQAAADLAYARQFGPAAPGTALARVVVADLSGNPAEAETYLTALTAQSADKGTLHLDLGDFYMQAGQNAAANKHWAQAQQLGNTEATERLGASFRPAN